MQRHSGFTNGPVKLSIILASMLATSGCSDINFRQGLFEKNEPHTQLDPSDIRPLPLTSASNSELDQIDKKDPRFLLSEAARIAAEKGNHSDAFATWEKLITQYPEHEPAYVGYAASGRKIGAHQMVLAKLFDFKSRMPEATDISSEIAKVYYDMRDYKKALTEMDQAIKMQDQNWKLYSLRGVIADKLNYFSEAEASYAKALELSPNNSTILNNMAVSKMMSGDYKQAESLAVQAMQDKKPSIQVYRTYAKVLAMKGELNKAEELLTKKLNDTEQAQKVISSVRSEVSKPVMWGRQ